MQPTLMMLDVQLTWKQVQIPLIVGIMDGIHNSVLRLFLMIFCFLKYWRLLLLNHFSIQITHLVQDPNSRVKVAGVHLTRLISAQTVTKANSQEFLSAHCYQKINIPLYINLPRYMKQSVTPSITQTSTPWFYGKERPKLNLLLLLVVYSQQWLNKMKACPAPWILAFGKATFVTLHQILQLQTMAKNMRWRVCYKLGRLWVLGMH
uniref:Uncharacterized protein n=1 Tax=Populus trichocarpa TaxID=3694 RepID=A0A3N7G4M8_POPTR